MKFGIWCIVSGGVTGSRAAWLRDGDTLVTFETKDAAEGEASRLNQTMNNAFSRASFRYQARGI